MQAWLHVGNANLFALMYPSQTLFFFFFLARPESKMAFRSNWFKGREKWDSHPHQISFCNFLPPHLLVQGRDQDLSLTWRVRYEWLSLVIHVLVKCGPMFCDVYMGSGSGSVHITCDLGQVREPLRVWGRWKQRDRVSAYTHLEDSPVWLCFHFKAGDSKSHDKTLTGVWPLFLMLKLTRHKRRHELDLVTSRQCSNTETRLIGDPSARC